MDSRLEQIRQTRVFDLLQRARSSRFVRNVIVLSGSTAAGQGILALATPIMTRLYTPDAFGRYGIFLSVIGIASVAVTMRYDVAIPGAADDDEALSLVVLALVATIPLSLLLSVLIWLLVHFNALSFGQIGDTGALIAAPALIGFGATSALRYWMIRRQQFQTIATVSIGQGACRAAVPIALQSAALGWLGIAAGEIAGRWFGIMRMLRAAWPDVRRAFTAGWKARAIRTERHYRRFMIAVLPSSMMDAISLALPVPLMSYLYGAEAGGVFLLAQRLIAIPSSLVGASVADVFHADAAQLLKDAPSQLPSSVRQVCARLLQVGSLMLLPLAMLAPVAAEPLLGKGWGAVGTVLAIMIPVALGNLSVGPVSRVLFVVKRGELKFLYDLLTLLLLVVTLHTAKASGLSFRAARRIRYGTSRG